MGIWYTTREDVASAQDIQATAYSAPRIDRAIERGARAADALLHRRNFAPTIATRRFDWPGVDIDGRTLYLGADLLISVTSAVTGGVTLAPGDYFLEPTNDGPPYRRIVLDEGASAYWSNLSTPQQAVAFTGVWGWNDDSAPAGTTAEALDASETGVDVGAVPTVGVGTVLRVDDERMVVTGRGWLTTGQTTTLGAQALNVSATVSDGSAFAAGETLLIESERVLVVDVAGNVLTLKRAVQGSALAAHAGATIYASRSLTVQRGALGTTAATHSTSAAVTRWVPPAVLSELNLAYAVNDLLQQQSGYARTVGSGDNQREASGRGIRDIERDARSALGRQARTAAV